MPIIGIEKLYVAVQTKDDSTGLTYNTPKYYSGIQTLTIKPKQNTEKLYAENMLWDQATTLDSVDVEIDVADLTSAQRAELLGQTVASGGGVYAAGSDIAPYVAVLYKATLRNGGHRYGILYKGAFQLPEDNLEGQQGKVKFQAPKVKATFQTTKNNLMWEYHIDTTDPNCPVDLETTWFNTVTIPGGDSTAPTLSSTTPANDATGVLATTTFAWVFSEAIDAGSVVGNNFFLAEDIDGSLVTGTLSQSADGLTVTFTPTSNLAATTVYRAICSGVRDLAGNALALPQVGKFTTT